MAALSGSNPYTNSGLVARLPITQSWSASIGARSPRFHASGKARASGGHKRTRAASIATLSAGRSQRRGRIVGSVIAWVLVAIACFASYAPGMFIRR